SRARVARRLLERRDRSGPPPGADGPDPTPRNPIAPRAARVRPPVEEIGAMQLGKLGCWNHVDHLKADEATAFARRVEDWGYSTFWVPEAVGRDPFSLIGFLAAKTSRIVYATGIANIYARDPMLMKAIWKTVAGLAPDRFILGLAVPHTHLVTGQRGHVYGKPVATMRSYLEAMQKALYLGPEPERDAPIVIGALRDRMLELSATRAQGAHPYNVTPE